MIRVGFSGARGVGKSTLVRSVCNRIKKYNESITNPIACEYKDGIARNFFKLCKNVNIKVVFNVTKEICIAGRLITDYLEDIYYTEDNEIYLYSRTLFDLYAYWEEYQEGIDNIVYDIYGNKPLDLLVVLLTSPKKYESFLKPEAELRGYKFEEFSSLMEEEQDKIIKAIFCHAENNYFKKLILLRNDYTNKTLNINTELLTDVIMKLYNEKGDNDGF